jgi:hypothetical protein
MITWRERPREEAALFNPAYLALILHGLSNGYRKEQKAPLPLVLAFVGVPLVANGTNRAALPRSVATSLGAWFERNPEIRERLPTQCRAFVGLVQSALQFGLSGGVLEMTSDGGIAARGKVTAAAGSEHLLILNRATLAGRLLARAGNTTTAMRLAGVTP